MERDNSGQNMSKENKVKEENPDWNWDYWEAQLIGFEEALRKPIWRDYLQTQKKLMDKVHDFFWEEELYNF